MTKWERSRGIQGFHPKIISGGLKIFKKWK
jgi:hypothetical protein